MNGYNFITMKGISHKSFLLTLYEETFCSDVNVDFLYQFFNNVRLATHLDLIVPRIA